MRKIERTAEQQEDDAEAEIGRGHCWAVRPALSDDGLPPLAASGLILHERLEAIAASLDRGAAKAGMLPGGIKKLRQLLRRGLEETAALRPPVRAADRWVKQVAKTLKNSAKRPASVGRQRLTQILSRRRQAAARMKEEAVREQLLRFVKVTKS